MKTKIFRISKRSISLLLSIIMIFSMMLVGMVPSNAAISYWFVSGSFNDWIQSPGNYKLTNNSITLDMIDHLNVEIQFKMVAYENDNVWCGKSDGNAISADSKYELTWGGDSNNIKFTPTQRYVTFSMSSENNKNYLTVTQSGGGDVDEGEITKWHVTGKQDGNTNITWDVDNLVINGSTGEVTLNTNGNTNPIDFKLVAQKSDGSKYLCTATGNADKPLTKDTLSDPLDWYAGPSDNLYTSWTNFDTAVNSSNCDIELVYNPTSSSVTSVTFTITSDGDYNYVTVSETTSSTDSDTHSVNQTSEKTIIVSYDRNGDYRNYAHVWHTDPLVNGATEAGEMTSVSGIDGLYYIDITNSGLQADTQINFIAKYGIGWDNDKSDDIKNSEFKKGKQWYIYQNSSGDDDNAEYTPLELDSLKYGTITGGTSNTIKAVPAGGVPWLMNETSNTAQNYTFNVYVGEGTSGTQIVNAQSVAYNGELSFNWTPELGNTSQKLTFVLSDGIETITYTQTFTVESPEEVVTHTVRVNPGENGDAYISSYTDSTGTVQTNSSTSLKSVDAKEGTTVTMKAVPATGYKVSAWNGTASSNTTYTTGSISSDTTVTVTFESTGTETKNWYITGVLEAPAGKFTNLSSTQYKMNAESNGTYTYTYTFGANDKKLYVVMSDGTTAYHPAQNNSDSTGQYPATIENNEFNIEPSWQAEFPAGTKVKYTWNPSTKKLTWQKETSSDDGPVVDKSKPITGVYLIYSESSNNPSNMTKYINLYEVNGEAIAYFSTDITDFKTGTDYYFALSSVAGGSTAYQSMYWQSWANDSPTSFNVTPSDSELLDYTGTQEYNADEKTYKFPKFKAKALTESVQICVGTYNNSAIQGSTYTIRPYSSVSSAIHIYAKDGTIRSEYHKYSKMADTVFEDNDKLLNPTRNDAGHRSEAYAPLGTTFTITTTIDTNYRDTYYVRAFNVNGESYGITSKAQADANTTGEYTLTYTIPEDFEDDSIEITPVYFYKNETDTITFYVEGFDDAVKEQWGDTIACHAYYDGGGDDGNTSFDSDTKNALGGYPGQPMVYEGGKYYMQIPKYLNGDTSVPFQGITLNNFVWDDVHAGRVENGTGNNCQTYDYNDLAVIAERGGDGNIIFAFKYRTQQNNDPNAAPNDEESFQNGWEPLTDHSGINDVDIFGNVLTTTEVSDNTRLRIVSNGYASGSSYIGKYATEWSIYAFENNEWKLIDKIASSALLYASVEDLTAAGVSQDHIDAYTALKAYEKYPAEITYELSYSDAGAEQKGNRSDGRWYFAESGTKITANTKIEYAADMNGTFETDPYIEDSNQGSTTLTKAYFTNDDEEKNGLTTADGKVDNTKNFTFKAEPDAAGKYYFVGWYLLKEGVYTFITKDTEAYAPMTATETYVARFINMPTGMMTLTHSLYKDAPEKEGMAEPNNGTGTCYIQVDILDSTGTNVIKTYDKTTNPITIGSNYLTATSDKQLKVTLTTDINGLSTFYNHYVNTEDGYSAWNNADVEGLTGTVTKPVTFEISQLFKVGADGNPEFYVDALNFYSDIIPVTKDYKFTYNYIDRFGAEKSYVVLGTLSEAQIDKFLDNNKAVVIPDSFVMSRAPYEDNFGKNITWNENTTSKGVDTDGTLLATLDSTQSDHTVVVNYRTTPDGPFDPELAVTLPFGEAIKDKNGEYITTDFVLEDGKKFDYWGIYTDYDCTNLVAKCYSNKFNYIAYGNYYISPVYSENPTPMTDAESYATIDFLEYSRNQWTDANGDKTTSMDKLYADFNLAFNYKGQLLNEASNVECGLLLEVCDQIEKTADGSYITDLSRYNIDTNKEELVSSLLDGTKYVYDGKTRNLIKHKIDGNDIKLNNKNRVELYRGFNNTTNNSLYIIKCYSYMIIDGTEVVLSEPVYINLFDVANYSLNILEG